MEFKEKRKKLESIKNEVSEFHPLLKKLLPKLPNVINIEYTHGPNEKGADFIIQTHHNVLKSEIYIGCIVKIGEITKNLININEQIEDSKLKRYIFNGKRNIHMDEIWVITNGSITNHAKEKIHEKYNKIAIQFLDWKNILQLIDDYLPNYWYEIPLSIGDYLSKLHATNKEMDKNLCLINVEDRNFYIEQELSRWNSDWSDKKIKQKKENVDIYREIDSSNVIYIEGGMGSGKSKLIRKLIDYYSLPETFLLKKFLPISITFKEFIDLENESIESIILTKTSHILDIDKNDISHYLIFLDALDEVLMDFDRLSNYLSRLIENVIESKNVKLVFTSRIINIADNDEYKIFTKINHLEIKTLKPKNVISFIEKICNSANLSSRLYEDLKNSLLFKEIQRSPIGVILLARLLKENNLDLPQNLTELYSKYTELVLGRWDIDKGLQTQKEYEVAEVFIMELAKYSIENELIWINKNEALNFLKNYLSERNLGINYLEIFEKIVNRSGIIELNHLGDMTRFKHKGFIEYYYAKYHVLNSEKLEISNRFFQIYWSNVYFFYVGLKRDCPELIREIVALKPNNDFEQFVKIMNIGNILLAGYQSPYKVFSESLYKIFIEATEYYFDLKDKKFINLFSGLSEINLLCLMQGIMRHNYSYPFFSKALEDITLMISDDKQIDLNSKVYSLFFLSVIGLDLNRKDPFDFLINEYGNRLPIQLELAINFESKELKIQSKALKNINKRILKNLQKNQNYNSIANNLSKIPIIKK